MRGKFRAILVVAAVLGVGSTLWGEHHAEKAAKEEKSKWTHGLHWVITSHLGDEVDVFSAEGKVERPLVAKGEAGLMGARGVIMGPEGDWYVACSKKDKSSILRFGPEGEAKGVFAAGGGLLHPYALVFGPDENLYVSGQDNDAVTRYHGKTGKFMDVFVPAGTGGLKTIRDIVFGPDGNLYVASRDTDSVLRYDGKSGKYLGEFVEKRAGGLRKPIQIVFGPDGDLFVGSSGNSSVLRYAGKSGKFVGEVVGEGAHGLDAPSGLAFDPKTGDLLVASRLTHQILRFGRGDFAFGGVFIDGKQVGLENPEFIYAWEKK